MKGLFISDFLIIHILFHFFLIQVTSLVHMPNGKVYDPLVGQWMSPQWEGMMTRATEPQQLHLYRFNGNDPINVIPTRQYLKGMI